MTFDDIWVWVKISQKSPAWSSGSWFLRTMYYVYTTYMHIINGIIYSYIYLGAIDWIGLDLMRLDYTDRQIDT